MVLLKMAGTLLISIVAMLCRIMTKIALSKLFLHDFFIFFLVIAVVYYDLELCPGSMQIYLRQKISKNTTQDLLFTIFPSVSIGAHHPVQSLSSITPVHLLL